MVRKILVSQPKPSSDKSPYFEMEKEYDVELVFRPFIKVEGLSSKDFRQQKISILNYTAVVFTSRHAIDNYFKLAKEMRLEIPESMKYFCVTETIALYIGTGVGLVCGAVHKRTVFPFILYGTTGVLLLFSVGSLLVGEWCSPQLFPLMAEIGVLVPPLIIFTNRKHLARCSRNSQEEKSLRKKVSFWNFADASPKTRRR